MQTRLCSTPAAHPQSVPAPSSCNALELGAKGQLSKMLLLKMSLSGKSGADVLLLKLMFRDGCEGLGVIRIGVKLGICPGSPLP